MPVFIIIISIVMLAYWAVRTRILLHAAEHEIVSTLEADLVLAKAVLLGLRSMFGLGLQMAG
jgi:hypothetical protein